MEEEKKKKDNKHLTIISISVLMVVCGAWIFNWWYLDNLKDSTRGTFGDMFGAVNALFSGLAFGGIIITILLQRKELALQREELKQNRHELQRTADAQTAQNNTLLNQQYQTTFFNLLSGHNELISNLSFYGVTSNGYDGLTAFHKIVRDNALSFNIALSDRYFKSSEDTGLNPVYNLISNDHFFVSLFGDLKTLIKFIDEKLNDKLYHEILYNRLSVYEKYLVGLYCDCYDNDSAKFIQSLKHDYNHYYKESGYKYKLVPENYFPDIKINRTRNTHEYWQKDIDATTNLFSFRIVIDYDIFNLGLIVNKVEVSAFDNKNYNKFDNKIFSKSIDLGKNEVTPDLGKIVNISSNLLDFIKGLSTDFVIMWFEFELSYHNIVHSVRYSIDIGTAEVNRAGNPGNERRIQFTHEK